MKEEYQTYVSTVIFADETREAVGFVAEIKQSPIYLAVSRETLGLKLLQVVLCPTNRPTYSQLAYTRLG